MKDNRGETLTEVLASLLVMVLGLLMLPGAIIASARLDCATEKRVVVQEVETGSNKGNTAGTGQVAISGGGTSLSYAVDFVQYGEGEGSLYQWKLSGD